MLHQRFVYVMVNFNGGAICKHGVCYMHAEWQPVVHIVSDLPGDNFLVSQLGKMLPTWCLVQVIAAVGEGGVA